MPHSCGLTTLPLINRIALVCLQSLYTAPLNSTPPLAWKSWPMNAPCFVIKRHITNNWEQKFTVGPHILQDRLEEFFFCNIVHNTMLDTICLFWNKLFRGVMWYSDTVEVTMSESSKREAICTLGYGGDSIVVVYYPLGKIQTSSNVLEYLRDLRTVPCYLSSFSSVERWSRFTVLKLTTRIKILLSASGSNLMQGQNHYSRDSRFPMTSCILLPISLRLPQSQH